MPRVKRAVLSKKKKRKIISNAKGFYGARKRKYKSAKEALMHSMVYAYRDRRVKKRDFRSLWIVRINAAARLNGLSYNNFMHGLKLAGIDINRKILADLAVTDATAFSQLAETAKKFIS